MLYLGHDQMVLLDVNICRAKSLMSPAICSELFSAGVLPSMNAYNVNSTLQVPSLARMQMT